MHACIHSSNRYLLYLGDVSEEHRSNPCFHPSTKEHKEEITSWAGRGKCYGEKLVGKEDRRAKSQAAGAILNHVVRKLSSGGGFKAKT